MSETDHLTNIRINISCARNNLSELSEMVEYLAELPKLEQSDIDLLEQVLMTSENDRQALMDSLKTFVRSSVLGDVEEIEIDVLETENGLEIIRE